jgi:hypothetical protein
VQHITLYRTPPCSTSHCIALHRAAPHTVSHSTVQHITLYRTPPYSTSHCIALHRTAHHTVSHSTQHLALCRILSHSAFHCRTPTHSTNSYPPSHQRLHHAIATLNKFQIELTFIFNKLKICQVPR